MRKIAVQSHSDCNLIGDSNLSSTKGHSTRERERVSPTNTTSINAFKACSLANQEIMTRNLNFRGKLVRFYEVLNGLSFHVSCPLVIESYCSLSVHVVEMDTDKTWSPYGQ